LENEVADTVSQSPFRDHIHIARQEFLQINQKSAEVEQTPAGFKIEEEVHIAIRAGVAASMVGRSLPIRRGERKITQSDMCVRCSPAANRDCLPNSDRRLYNR